MKTLVPFFRFFVLFICLFTAASWSYGQEVENYAATVQPANKPNLLQRLNLTNQQIRQIRILNRERRPQLQAAQQRLRQLNQTLDQAVYADAEDDAEIQRLTQEVHQAQQDVLRHRIGIERSIRGLLTAEQLSRFRILREQFEQNRADKKPVRRVLKNARRPALRRVNRQ